MMNAKTHETDGHGNHIIPLKTYLAVGAALILLTIITVAVSRINLGPLNLIVAMLIASTKAVLVALIFMHLLYDSKVYAGFFAGALVFLGVFIILTMYDTMRRGDIAPEEKMPIQARAQIYDEDGKPLNSGEHHGEAGKETDGETVGSEQGGDAGSGTSGGHEAEGSMEGGH